MITAGYFFSRSATVTFGLTTLVLARTTVRGPVSSSVRRTLRASRRGRRRRASAGGGARRRRVAVLEVDRGVDRIEIDRSADAFHELLDGAPVVIDGQRNVGM